jgi:undecaprenyl-diphosphatase
MEQLLTLDEKLFLLLNRQHNTFFDPIMYWASNEFCWIPMYVLLFIFLLRRYGSFAWYIFICIALLITSSDQLSSNLIKNLVQRPRPSHAISLAGKIHLSEAGPGGEYGFVSSHAANTFALAIFLILLLPRQDRRIKYLLLGWAALVSYSRIYNGVHYPGDVLGGMLLGGLLAYLFIQLFRHFQSFYLLKIKRQERYRNTGH